MILSSQDSKVVTLLELFREYDQWNAEVRPCTKQAVGVAVHSLLRFLRQTWEIENRRAADGDFDVAVCEISGRDIGHWRAWLLQGERDGCGGWSRRPASAHTVHSYHASLRQLFRYGMELQPPLIESSPMDGVKNKRPPQPEPDVWSRGEIASLFRGVRRIQWQEPTAAVRWTAILYGLLHGMRINEITTRQRKHLRPQDRMVFVCSSGDKSGECWQWTSKTAVDRAIGISPQYARALRRLMRACPWAYPHLSRKACAARIEHIGDLTWRQKQQPYSVANRDFNRIVAEANVIRLERGQPTIAVAYPHMGRKTAATDLAAQCIHPKVLATIMGWSSPETGNRYYIKVQQDQAISVARSCFAAIGRRRTCERRG